MHEARRPQSVDIYVGERLRLAREARNLSLPVLSEVLGLTFKQLHKYESGVNRISAGRLYQLACALEVPIMFFFDGWPAVPHRKIRIKPKNRRTNAP